MSWNPDHTPCAPDWWNQWGCAAPPCSPCSWTVPPGLPVPVAPMSPYYPFAPYAPPYPGYGFDRGCCAPPPPPTWAPRQWPAWPRARICPQVYVGGACCDECASGAPCAGASPCCQPCADGLPCACAPQAIAVGPHVGAEGLPMSVVKDFDAEVQHLNADIGGQGGPATQAAWAGFYPAWNQWYSEVSSATGPIFGFGFDFIAGERLDKFNEFAQQYNLLLTKAGESGVKTSAKPYDPRSPLEKGLEEGAKGAGQGLGGFGAALGDTLGKGLLIGAAAAGLYFLGPPLLAAALKKRRKAA